MHELRVIPGHVVLDVLRRKGTGVIDLVAETYLLHAQQKTINPHSYFLQFPDNERNRIIALPAAITDSKPISGIKWIASYPDNIQDGLPRASAILILNDARTGYPIACIEAAQISATRTAASAVLVAQLLRARSESAIRIGVVGAGIIARNILEMFRLCSREIEQVLVHDLDQESSRALTIFVQRNLKLECRIAGCIDDVFQADVVVLATTASKPYLNQQRLLRPGQTVLNVSLRDLSPELILSNWNIVDDIDHCLKAGTSPHLAAEMSGSRDFIAGTVADLLLGRIKPDRGRALIFSPFGLGVLDLALGRFILEEAANNNGVLTVPGFFSELSRWESVA